MHTSNAMLLLSRLYQYSSDKFYRFLGGILPENSDIELSFHIQDKINGGTIPDATISQASFKIVIETKLSGNFTTAQLQGHLQSFAKEDCKVLLTLDPEPLRPKAKAALGTVLAAYNQTTDGHVIHRHLTFEDIINMVEDVIDNRDDEMQDVLRDYHEYCFASGLIRDDWKWMRIRLTGVSFDVNMKYNLYYDSVPNGFSGHAYLGLYNQKSVRAIGKICAIAVAYLREGELIVEEEQGAVTPGMKVRVLEAMDMAREQGHPIHTMKLRYFFVETFYETDFRKESKGALMGTKFFDLCEILQIKTLPDTAAIAAALQTECWQ